MSKKERWGSDKKYPRNWIEYNEELVVRGEFLLDLDWVKTWNEELAQMNYKKAGRKYEFPNSLINLQGVWHQWVDLRGIEGITRKIAETNLIPKFNDYTTIGRRINKINVNFVLPRQGKVSVSTDGSGMKMNNAGEYRQTKYGRGRKKFLKVTITADPNDKTIYDLDVSVEGEGDSEPKVAEKHIQKLIDNGVEIDKFYGDGAFDTKSLFNLTYKHKIEPIIKIRENASTKARGSIPRKKEVVMYKEKGYKEWSREKGYGMRWPGTEGIFSAVKRKFGEKTRSKSIDTMCKEVRRRFWAYEIMKNYAKV